MDDAEVSYPEGRAVVKYDPAVVAPETFIAELEEMTGYEVTIVATGDSAGPAVARETK